MFYTNRIFVERKVNCLDDCKQSGCPGHVIRIDIHDTTGTGTYSKDGKEICTFDCNEAESLLQMLLEIKSE